MISKERSNSVYIIDSEIETVDIGLVPLSYSFQARLHDQQPMKEGTRAHLTH